MAEKFPQTAASSLQPLRQTPNKMATAPSPYNPQAVSNSTYKALTHLHQSAARPGGWGNGILVTSRAVLPNWALAEAALPLFS